MKLASLRASLLLRREISSSSLSGGSSRTWLSIKEALNSKAHSINKIKTKGWVKSVRHQKNMIFIDINDGSCLKNLQAVSAMETLNIDSDRITVGSSVEVEGTLVASSHHKQSVELSVSSIEILGTCDSNMYPFKARMRHGSEYIRQFPHLRSRTNSFSSILRIRNTLSMAIHDYFQKKGYILVHTPVITSSDCEGAGDLFQVISTEGTNDPLTNKDHFFDAPVYLTVSGQLHAETIACGMSKVYTFGPTFRAERSHTRRHLSEFYMLEAETVMTSSSEDEHLEEILQCSEELCKSLVERVLTLNSEDVDFLHSKSNTDRSVLDAILDCPYKRVTYEEAIDILEKDKDKENFEYSPQFGSDLASEHEKHLVKVLGNTPVFVTEFPSNLKPFYAKTKKDDRTTLSMDLLMPVVGELIGGTIREERLDILKNNLTKFGISHQDYDWYLDTRRFGTIPHGGFGLGFDRFLQVILGIDNIRDIVPYPRYCGSSPM